MATKCMSCGGSMKKMKTGGASGDKCKFPLCGKYEGSSFVGCFPCSAGVKAGLATSIGGVLAGVTKIASDAKKKRTAVKAGAKTLRAADPEMTKRASMKESRKKINNPVPEEKRGGTVKKKYAMGGATLPMMGMPMYSNNPRSEQGRILKAGGSTINRAVAPGCRGGMVKDASGKCVMERKFKAGGTINKKFAALAPPYNKATAADRIAGAKKNARKK